MASWDVLGPFGAAVWVHAAPRAGILGYLESLLGLSWGRSGAALGRLERVLEASWTHLRASWRPLSVTRGSLGASSKRLGCDIGCDIRRKLELN